MSPGDAETMRCTALRFGSGCVEHTRLPPHDSHAYTSTTAPFAFGVSFTGHRAAVLGSDGKALQARSFRPSTVGLNGPRAVTWLHVSEPSEGVEIHPAPRVLDEVAALTHCQWDDLESYRQLSTDEVIWAASVMFRAAALRRRTLTEDEAEGLILNLTIHVAVHHLGGRSPRSFAGRLAPDLVGRVAAHLHRNCDRAVTLAEMASVAVMSPYHFHRSFHRAVGLTPSTFAMALRMERAHRLLAAGRSPREAADAVGIGDPSYFRRSYRRFLGEPAGVNQRAVSPAGAASAQDPSGTVREIDAGPAEDRGTPGG